MSAGLAALLDDVAALARVTAASLDDIAAGAGRAGVKAAGVIVDDAAVTPRFVEGIKPDRELPMIWRIAKGSLRNKLLFILPAVLLLSQFLPWSLTPVLMLGGTYLCYEGAEKIWEKIGPGHEKQAEPVITQGREQENTMVSGAIRTDFILSAEIMVIALNEVADQAFVSRALSLIVVAIGITLVVYGAVGLIVKMDDAGLHLATSRAGSVATFGRGLVKGMPVVLAVLSTVGIAAMIWVGGHIILVGVADLGWSPIYDAVRQAEEAVAGVVPAIGGFAAWLTNTFASAVLGLIVGAIVVAVLQIIPRKHKAAAATDDPATAGPSRDDSPPPTDGLTRP